MHHISIIGSGLAGLLAANMLRRHSVTVYEKQPELPNNHQAVLRFRDKGVSNQLHIPFREVKVFKACDEPDMIRAAIQYSFKCTRRYEVRSLIDLAPATRYIAPPDLIRLMADGVDIRLGCDGAKEMIMGDPHVISTIPMPALMDALSYPGPRPDFISTEGLVVKATITDCDLFMTRYYARPDVPWYRASVTGDQLIIEFSIHDNVWRDDWLAESQIKEIAADTVSAVAMDFGFDPLKIIDAKAHHTRYAKIGRLDAHDRALAEAFMVWATTEHRVYSLGRFATWRSGLLLDDLVGDILKIERWMGQSAFNIRKSI
jgi:hypothetical protein